MKYLLTSLIVLTSGFLAEAQTDSSAINAADSSATERSTLTLGISIANNADYYGQKAAESMPYIAGVASYNHRSGFFVNFLTYRLLKKIGGNITSAYGAETGFDIDMKKGWSTELKYGFTYFPENSPFLQAGNPHSASITLEHEGWLTTSLEANYSFGHAADVFSTLALSKAISLFSLSPHDVIVFTPQADVTGGTQRFYTYYLKQASIRDSLTNALLEPILGGNPIDDPADDTTTKEVTSFDLLSYNLKLPLAYQRNNYIIELSTQLSLLGKKAQSQAGQVNAFFTASFYYQF